MRTVFGSFEEDQWRHHDGLICCCRKRQTTDQLLEDITAALSYVETY